MKFDLRMYVCLIGGSPDSPPLAFLCREGLARFCTEKYVEPSASNMPDNMAHLTNYSLNKQSSKFAHYGDDIMEEIFDLTNAASKRPLTVVLRQLRSQNAEFDAETFYNAVVQMVQRCRLRLQP